MPARTAARAPGDGRVHLLDMSVQDVVLAEMGKGVAPCGLAELRAPLGIACKLAHGCGHGLGLARPYHQAAAAADAGKLALLGLDHRRPSTREHAAEFGRQREARSERPLRQQMNIREIEEFVEALARLQRQHGHIVEIGCLRLDLVAQGTVACEHEMKVSMSFDKRATSARLSTPCLLPILPA